MTKEELLQVADELACDDTEFCRWASEMIRELIEQDHFMTDDYYRTDDDIDENYEKYDDINELYGCKNKDEQIDLLTDWYEELHAKECPD